MAGGAVGLFLGIVLAWATPFGLAVTRDGAVVDELSRLPRGERQPVTFLVVGTDSRERISDDAGDRFGPRDGVQGERADVVMLAQVVPEGRLRVLSLPRDLLVDVEGYGTHKLANALGLGGSPLLVRTVRQATGLPVHHYVEIDFQGFADAVDRLDGVVIDVPRPGRDVYSGLVVDSGRVRLDGMAALAYVRSRNYEEWHDGAWVPRGDGDLGRIDRQHAFLRALLDRLAGGPSVVERLRGVAELANHVTVDGQLSVDDLVGLARRFSSVADEQLELRTLPVRPLLDEGERRSPFPPFHLGTLNYVTRSEPAAAAVLQAFGASEPAS